MATATGSICGRARTDVDLGERQIRGPDVEDYVRNDVAGTGASCFAGYCDWRLPNIRELQSIVDYEVNGPAVAAASRRAHVEPGDEIIRRTGRLGIMCNAIG